jgi:hypothetical protein
MSSLRYLTDDDEVRAVWLLKNGLPGHGLSRERAGAEGEPATRPPFE